MKVFAVGVDYGLGFRGDVFDKGTEGPERNGVVWLLKFVWMMMILVVVLGIGEDGVEEIHG